jgi:hypothetical protein
MEKYMPKYLVENTTEGQIDLNVEGSVVSIPAAVTQGNETVNGWAEVDADFLDSLGQNKVVRFYFESKKLLMAGEVASTVDEAAEAIVTKKAK